MEAFLAFEKRTRSAIEAILKDLEVTKQALSDTHKRQKKDHTPKLVTPMDIVNTYLGPSNKQPEKTFSSVVSKKFDEDERRFTVLGSIPRANLMPGYKPIIKENATAFTEKDWKEMANHLRSEPFEKFTFIFPDSRERENDEVKAIAIEGADPAVVYKLFCLGLLKMVYPGTDFLEISHFPENLKKVISNFVAKTKSKKNLLLHITGVTPYWDNTNGEYMSPFQLIRLGSVNSAPIITKGAPLSMPADIEKYRDGGILNLFTEAKKISKNKQIKVNYFSGRLLMISHYKKERRPSETGQIEKWTSLADAHYLVSFNTEPIDDPAPMDVSTAQVAGPSSPSVERSGELASTSNSKPPQ